MSPGARAVQMAELRMTKGDVPGRSPLSGATRTALVVSSLVIIVVLCGLGEVRSLGGRETEVTVLLVTVGDVPGRFPSSGVISIGVVVSSLVDAPYLDRCGAPTSPRGHETGQK